VSSPVQSRQGGARVSVPPPLIFLGFLLVGVFLNRYMVPLAVPLPGTVRLVVGSVFLAAAIGLFASALRLFRATGQDPKPWLPSPSLVIEGPYRWTRNPIYVAMMLMQVGLGLVLDDVWVVVLSAASLAVVHVLAVQREEAYLLDRFGEPYRRYTARVRRYI